MPKVIVLFFGSDSAVVRAAEAAAAGARMVRFTEVDLRSSTLDTRHKLLDPVDALEGYHGIVLVSVTPADPKTHAREGEVGTGALRLDDALSRIAAAPDVADLVLGIVGGDRQDVARLAQVGGITVSASASAARTGEATGPADLTLAEATGFRVAKVTAWVRHGLGHEAAHHHAKN